MNTYNLSKRLKMVANYILPNSRLADIGSDHAYLPCYVVKKGIVPFAIAGEVADGPFQSAKSQVLKEQLEEQISVRKGDGLEVVSPGEVDCITIAGMGGTLITSILERGKEKLSVVNRLILQPNINARSIRIWLKENGWQLLDEQIIEEDGKIYEILVAEQGDGNKPYEGKNEFASLLLGPYLLERKGEVFQKKWLSEMKSWEKILAQLENATPTEENERKKEELREKISFVKEALQ